MSVSVSEVKQFTQQFSADVDAGTSLIECLNRATQRQVNSEFRQVIEQVNEEIKVGNTLSHAMKKHADIFDTVYTTVIRQGEVSGKLELALQLLA